MHFYSSLIVILAIQGLYGNRSVMSSHTTTVIQRGARNTKDTDWKAISSLIDQAYSELDRNKGKGNQLFTELAAKMEVYIRKYETDPESFSYLRALVYLGAWYQNADNPKQARIVFEQCERHREFNSRDATLDVTSDGRQVKESIANYVKARLCFLTNCSKPEYKAAYEVVRRTGGGSSRGDELAPPFSIPTPKAHQPKRGRAPLK
jgi:hypothetical protein